MFYFILNLSLFSLFQNVSSFNILAKMNVVSEQVLSAVHVELVSEIYLLQSEDCYS